MENRLNTVTRAGQTIASYWYDAAGNRVRSYENGVAINYVYDGLNVLQEDNVTSGVKTDYVFGFGRQLARVAGGVTTYIAGDHLGSTSILTDAAGAPLGNYSYEPYGNLSAAREAALGGPVDTKMETETDLYGRVSGTVTKSTDRVEGQYSLKVETGVDPYDFANYWPSTQSPIDPTKYRYVKVSVKPSTGATSLSFYIQRADGVYATFLSPDGDSNFGVGAELIANQWNTIVLDLQATSPSLGTGVCSTLHWHTNDESTWYWDQVATTNEPVGKVLSATDSEGEPYKFTGKPLSNETGLYYFAARWYDPSTGRFMSQDPIKHGANWYEYCGGDPVNKVDPSGLVGLKMEQGEGGGPWTNQDIKELNTEVLGNNGTPSDTLATKMSLGTAGVTVPVWTKAEGKVFLSEEASRQWEQNKSGFDFGVTGVVTGGNKVFGLSVTTGGVSVITGTVGTIAATSKTKWGVSLTAGHPPKEGYDVTTTIDALWLQLNTSDTGLHTLWPAFNLVPNVGASISFTETNRVWTAPWLR